MKHASTNTMRWPRNAGGAASPRPMSTAPATSSGSVDGEPAGAWWLPFGGGRALTFATGPAASAVVVAPLTAVAGSSGYFVVVEAAGCAVGCATVGGATLGGATLGGGQVTAPSFATVAPRTTSSSKSTRKLRLSTGTSTRATPAAAAGRVMSSSR